MQDVLYSFLAFIFIILGLCLLLILESLLRGRPNNIIHEKNKLNYKK